MDVKEKDDRLEQLKSALETIATKETPTVSTKTTTSYDWKDFDINQLPALTTIDLSQLTTHSIPALSANSAVTPTVYTIGGGGGGGSGAVYTGTGLYHYPNTSISNGATWTNAPTTVQIKADDIEIKGKSLLASLNRIEERLGILDCDEILEEEWQELRDLGEQYRKLKTHIEEKMKTFNTLKK